MRRTAKVIVLGLWLTACAAAPGNEIAPGGGQQPVPRDHGVILFGYESTKEDPPVYWGLDIRRIDHSGRPETPNDSKLGANVVAFRQWGGMLARDEPFAAFSVLPGEYALTAMMPMQDGGMFREMDYRGGAGQAATMGAAGVLAYVVIAAAAAGERAAEEARFGPRAPSPLNFLNPDGSVRNDAPRFTVKAGEIAYVGEFLFGARRYFDERPVRGAVGETWTRVIISPFVENVVDPSLARAAQRRYGLGAWPIHTIQSTTWAQGPLYFAPSMDRDRVDWLSAGTVVREETVHARPHVPRPGLPRTPQPAIVPASNPTAAEPRAQSKEELQRRFLAGEISVEQYKAAIKRP